MARSVLDTNVLIYQWNRRSRGAAQPRSKTAVFDWARELVRMHDTDAILTPVKIEFACGVRSRNELKLAENYLSVFCIADKGKILPEDWKEAERLARRVPSNRKPRQLGDCLVRAIARRLRLDVITYDATFPT